MLLLASAAGWSCSLGERSPAWKLQISTGGGLHAMLLASCHHDGMSQPELVLTFLYILLVESNSTSKIPCLEKWLSSCRCQCQHGVRLKQLAGVPLH